MFKNEQLGLCTSTMDPRISFSSDFVDTTQLAIKNDNIYREAPVSSDFEFSVKNFGMKSADEIIFQGMLLPVKENSTNQVKKTLKDELLVDDDGYDDVFSRPSKSLGRWKERLGLKKANILARKGNNKNDEMVLERVVEDGRPMYVHEAELTRKENQESLFGGGFKFIDNAI